jgi:hypothetical protein
MSKVAHLLALLGTVLICLLPIVLPLMLLLSIEAMH